MGLFCTNGNFYTIVKNKKNIRNKKYKTIVKNNAIKNQTRVRVRDNYSNLCNKQNLKQI